MTKIIAILNHKGGVGKTTTAVNLGGALNLLGMKVLLVDLDPQCNATKIMGFEGVEGITLFDALIDKSYKTPLPIYEHCEGFDIVPAHKDMSGIESYLDNRRIAVNKVLKKLIAKCETMAEDAGEKFYDYILIDCPPSLGILTINAMSAANSVIIPINRQLALLGMADLLEKVEEVKEDNPGLYIEGYLMTDFNRRLKSVQTTQDYVDRNCEERIFESRIRHNETLSSMIENQQSVFEYDKKCNGAKDYMDLAQELSGLTYNG